MNGECPRELGGAQVLAYALVGPDTQHTERTRQIVAGELKGAASAMVIAQYDGDEGYYLFGCYGQEWDDETDTWHESIADAIAQMDFEYENLSKNLIWYAKPE